MIKRTIFYLKCYQNGKGSLDYAKNLVEFGGIILRQDHHGAHVECVDLCQLRRKIGAAEKSGVSHRL